jgi:hypothetical protein
MKTRKVLTPTSRVMFGHAREDITPPVGIYHRMWGAARHDRSTGVHRPILADVMIFGSLNDKSDLLVRAHIDLVGLVTNDHHAVVSGLSKVVGVGEDRIDLTYSHSHSSGFYMPDRVALPGGELIPEYLEEVANKVSKAGSAALEDLKEAVITYATGHCNMAANRDCHDEAFGGYVCGFNPDVEPDDTVLVGRVTDLAHRQVATLVNYGCHPTTLAWDNTLLSPDYVGTMREEVERVTDCPCIFAQAPSGNQGPRHGFVGDLNVADKNGRQLGFAALSALMSMGPPGTDYEYQGPVISGATIGTWAYTPLTEERREDSAVFATGVHTVELPRRTDLDTENFEQQRVEWTQKQKEADAEGDVVKARDFGARAERAKRWMGRLQGMPEGPNYPYRFSVRRLGNAVWVSCGGEPYSTVQVELRRRFPDCTLLFSPLTGTIQVAYLMDEASYGKGLYQEEPSSLAKGCLEILIEAMAEKIAAVIS